MLESPATQYEINSLLVVVLAVGAFLIVALVAYGVLHLFLTRRRAAAQSESASPESVTKSVPLRAAHPAALTRTPPESEAAEITPDERPINLRSSTFDRAHMRTYDTATIRELLNAAFSDEEMLALCFDRFPEAYNNLSTGMSKGQKVQQLLDYCMRRDQLSDLLAVVQARNPAQFKRYEERLRA